MVLEGSVLFNLSNIRVFSFFVDRRLMSLEAEILKLVGNLEGLSTRISELTEIQKALGGIEVSIKNLDNSSNQHRTDIQKLYSLVSQLRADLNKASPDLKPVQDDIIKLQTALRALNNTKNGEPKFEDWIKEQNKKVEKDDIRYWDVKRIIIGTVFSILAGTVIWFVQRGLTNLFK